jgi:hypothetical protein
MAEGRADSAALRRVHIRLRSRKVISGWAYNQVGRESWYPGVGCAVAVRSIVFVLAVLWKDIFEYML